jgi:hypothetical protein
VLFATTTFGFPLGTIVTELDEPCVPVTAEPTAHVPAPVPDLTFAESVVRPMMFIFPVPEAVGSPVGESTANVTVSVAASVEVNWTVTVTVAVSPGATDAELALKVTVVLFDNTAFA